MCQSIDDVLFVGIGWIFFWYFLLGLQTGSKVLLFRETYPFPKKWQKKKRFYLLVPRGTREKGPIKWTVRPSFRSLPRYLQIAWMDFFENFRKIQSYANGGMGKECSLFLKYLAEKLSEAQNESYNTVIGWIRTRLSFEIIKSVIRGSRVPFRKKDEGDMINDFKLNVVPAAINTQF